MFIKLNYVMCFDASHDRGFKRINNGISLHCTRPHAVGVNPVTKRAAVQTSSIRTYIFYQSLNRVQRGLSAIAELLVIK